MMQNYDFSISFQIFHHSNASSNRLNRKQRLILQDDRMLQDKQD